LNQVTQILALVIPILFALTIHELSHGLMALHFGDPTAKNAGRLTLNPLAHLDPIGTLMLFIVHFGWAKPVPVNPAYFKDPKKDMIWVSLAGPVSNIILAFLTGMIIRVVGMEMSNNFTLNFLKLMLYYSLTINLALAVFNLIPIPPLDGSKILQGLLPPKYDEIMYNLERYGPFILLGIIMFGRFAGFSIIGSIIWPFVNVFANLFAGMSI
jgi:Zn-dependent protease